MAVNTLKALLIDHDGTLVNSEPCQHLIWQSILKKFDVNFTFDDFIPRIGIPGEITAGFLVKRYNLPITAESLAEIKRHETTLFLQRDKFPLMKGMVDIINWAKANKLKLAIVSGAEKESVLNSLQQHKLISQIDLVVAGGDVINNKPAPDCYLKALELLGLPAESAIALEDSSSGIEAAKSAQLTCFAIQHSFTPTTKLLGAHQIFDSHEAILKTLKLFHCD